MSNSKGSRIRKLTFSPEVGAERITAKTALTGGTVIADYMTGDGKRVLVVERAMAPAARVTKPRHTPPTRVATPSVDPAPKAQSNG